MDATVQLDRVSAMLREVDAFAASRVSVTSALGALARGLPLNSVLQTCDFADGVGEAQVLTADPAAALAGLRNAPGFSAVTLNGTPVRVVKSSGALQQIKIRFRFNSPSPPTKLPGTTP